MLYVTPHINTFSLCSITVSSELAHLWIRFLKSLHRINEMEKSIKVYILSCTLTLERYGSAKTKQNKKNQKHTCNHNKA